MKDIAEFDPLTHKTPLGPVASGAEVNFFVASNPDCSPERVTLLLRFDGESYCGYEMHPAAGGFEVKVKFEHCGHYFYHFLAERGGLTYVLGMGQDCKTSIGSDSDFFQSVTKHAYPENSALSGGLIYQIFPDRFCSSGEVLAREPLTLRRDWGGKIKRFTSDPVKINGEVFGGNLFGIIEKLPYLQSLGVTVIYLNPIFEANSCHKYDTANYMKVDGMLGGDAALAQLIAEAKARGIEILLDGVFNHTGSDSIYFNKLSRYSELGAYNSRESKYYSWYNFYNYPDGYNSWWGISTLPSINRNATDFQSFIAGEGGVIEKYMKMGVLGFRLDVVDEISDEFVQKISQKIHSYGESRVVMGEVWEDAATKISYSERRKYFSENELNSVMNYPFRDGIVSYFLSKDSSLLSRSIKTVLNNYPRGVTSSLMNFFDTHDTGRFYSELLRGCSNDNLIATEIYKLALAMLFTLPGVPSLLYGDEIAMEDNDGSSRGCFDWGRDCADLQNIIAELAMLRQHPAIKYGDCEILISASGKFAFSREFADTRIIAAFNLRPTPLRLELPEKCLSFFTGKAVSTEVLLENQMDILLETK